MNKYERPEAEVVIFESVDVVATSGTTAPPHYTTGQNLVGKNKKVCIRRYIPFFNITNTNITNAKGDMI